VAVDTGLRGHRAKAFVPRGAWAPDRSVSARDRPTACSGNRVLLGSAPAEKLLVTRMTESRIRIEQAKSAGNADRNARSRSTGLHDEVNRHG
jgi:hypothetical protein